MCVRQSAWLAAVPESKIKLPADVARQSRLEKIKDDGGAPEFPDPGAAAYLLEYFWDVGPTLGGDMGNNTLTNSELVCWQQNSAIDLNPWEARTLITLSRAYLAEANSATKADRPPPFGDLAVATPAKCKRIESNLDAFLD